MADKTNKPDSSTSSSAPKKSLVVRLLFSLAKFAIGAALISFATRMIMNHPKVKPMLIPTNVRIEQIMNYDLHDMAKSEKLKEPFTQLAEIQVKTDPSPLSEWLSNKSIHLSTTNQGKYRLEVLATMFFEGHRFGCMVQYDLVDLATKNTIWEVSRNYNDIGYIW